jgi:hypothetical protein
MALPAPEQLERIALGVAACKRRRIHIYVRG